MAKPRLSYKGLIGFLQGRFIMNTGLKSAFGSFGSFFLPQRKWLSFFSSYSMGISWG